MCWGPNYHYFHILGDGHQPNSRGLYTHVIGKPWEPMMNFVNFRFLSLEETLENGVDDAQRGGLKGRYAIEAW